MALYLVTWEIEICAETEREAAQKAFDIIRVPNTQATQFKVIEFDTEGEAVTVDLIDDRHR